MKLVKKLSCCFVPGLSQFNENLSDSSQNGSLEIKGCATVGLIWPFENKSSWNCYDDAGNSLTISFNNVSETLPEGSQCELMCQDGYELQPCE